MNHSVKTDEELLALLEHTMHKVSDAAPDMELTASAGNPRWMASAAAATVIAVGVGAAGLALHARHDNSGPLTPGAQPTTPFDSAEPITSTTMSSVDGETSAVTTTSIFSTTGTVRPLDSRDEAWRAAVYQEMASFGTCATTDYGVGSSAGFSAKTICSHFVDGQPVDGNLVFVIQELPATLDKSSGWQQKAAGFDTAGTPLSSVDAMMFVETSNGVTRRAAIVTPRYMVFVAAELIDDQYLPTGDHDLAVVLQHLNAAADTILTPAG
jgi:hypothetical protein